MSESVAVLGDLLNPCWFHLQKMEMELKCPMCLNLLSQPISLHCSHMYCRSCIGRLMKSQSNCLVCKEKFSKQDVHSVPEIERMVCLFKGLEAAFSVALSQSAVQLNPLVMPKLEKLTKDSKNMHQEADFDQNSNFENVSPVCFPNILFPNKKRVQSSPSAAEKDVSSRRGCLESNKSENKDLNIMFSLNVSEVHVDSRKSCSADRASKKQRKSKSGADKGDFYSKQEDQLSGADGAFDVKDPKDVPMQSKHNGAASKSEMQSNSPSSLQSSPRIDCHKAYDKRISKTTSCGVVDAGNKNMQANSGTLREMPSHGCAFVLDDCYNHNLESENADHADAIRNASPVSDSNTFVCAFCQSSGESMETGPMLHLTDGEAVSSAAGSTAMLHVHRGCAEWAPQVFYHGDNLLNLEAEISRSGKLKCCKCGKKGAALGCYAKSCRRTFHLPCARGTPQCRWDNGEFSMLCPVHSSLKFPWEKTRPKKKDSAFLKASSNDRFSRGDDGHRTLTLEKTSGWVFCGSALSSSEKNDLEEFASLYGVAISKTWDSNVTHVIASVDKNGHCSRSLKVLMATLAGKWILSISWIKASMEANCPVDEEPYEINGDIHECYGGPRNGRLRAMAKEPPLFHGLCFHFFGEFELSYKANLQELVLAAGGCILQDPDSSKDQFNDNQSIIVIYSSVLPQGLSPRESDLVFAQRVQEAALLAGEVGGRITSHGWLLDSIAACELQSIA